MITIGMEVMVTFNIDTDIDVANASRGCITDIIFDECESKVPSTEPVVELEDLPAFILVKMKHTKAATLDGLEPGILPLVPLEHTFNIIHRTRTSHYSASTAFDNFIRIYRLPFPRPNNPGGAH